MNTNDSQPAEAPQGDPRDDLLRAVLEALTVPYPADYRGSGKRLELLRDRAIVASAMIEVVLEDPASAASATHTLRRRTADMSVSYEVEGGVL